MRKKITTLLKIGFSVGIIYFLVRSNAFDFDALSKIFSIQFICFGLLIMLSNLVLGAERWRSLLGAQSIELKFFDSIKLTLMGVFFNYVVPGGVGGDVVKGYYIVRDNPSKKMAAAMSVLMDRVLGLYSMIIMALICLLFGSSPSAQVTEILLIKRSVYIFFVIFSVALAIAFSTKIRAVGVEKILAKLPMGPKWISAYEAAHAYGTQSRSILYALVLSALAQLSAVVLFMMVGQSMGLNVPYSVYFFVVPLGFIVTAIPISPAGVGVGQLAFYFLFNLLLGHATALGTIGITVLQILQFVFGIVGAWFFIRRKGHISDFQEKSPVEKAT